MDRPEEIEVVEVGDHEELGISSRKEEEGLVDENAEIFDTILLNEAVETVKVKLEVLKDQGRDTYGVFKSFFYLFSVSHTPHCPKFVEWCAGNFFVTEGVIMDRSKSKFLCLVQDLNIHKALHVPYDQFVHTSQAYE